ncbi:MAG: metalloregulator ArsR/SmtB family transcription factor [Methanosarcinaceae archaeon]|nr:metalloregulator ArsR/SmtB family transcription factor [Methanosarcinaceae archaeon]MDF1534804.1 metalloregulator ArsR/SmtB family transcription factor [Methanosarcinaceae archaeon]
MNDTCIRVDEPLIKQMVQNLPDEQTINKISAIFQALQSDTRLKILFLLSQKEMCVCELECALDVTQSAISHSLRALRQLDLVRVEKQGRFAIYYLADDHIRTLIDLCNRHVTECST